MTWFILGSVCGIAFGWGFAHTTVADECDKLGGFYVGKRAYKCERDGAGRFADVPRGTRVQIKPFTTESK